MQAGQNEATKTGMRPIHEIAVCRAPVKPGERTLLTNIAKRMAERGVNCFLKVNEGGISLVAAA